MNFGKCPKCEQVLMNVAIEDVNITVSFQPRWKGISYLCPFCNTVLSVNMDPIALKADLLSGVQSLLEKHKL